MSRHVVKSTSNSFVGFSLSSIIARLLSFGSSLSILKAIFWDGLKRVQNKQSVVEHFTEALLFASWHNSESHWNHYTDCTSSKQKANKTEHLWILGVHTWIKSMAGMKSNTLQFAVCVINGRRKPLRMMIMSQKPLEFPG